MVNLLIALVVLYFGYHAIKYIGRSDPKSVKRAMRSMGGVAACGVALLLVIRGQMELGLAAAGLGLWLIGWGAPPQWLDRLRGKSAAPASVTTRTMSVDIDPATGPLEGRVLAGPFHGRRFSELAAAQLDELRRSSVAVDPDGARLLEMYLDRRFPGWRETGHGDADARGGFARRAGAMTENEAYEVLGLQKGAPRDEITRAHRALMKKLHPDHGGTASLAARVNEAKEVLMRRHQ